MGSGQKINAFSLDSENYRYGFNAKEKDESGEFGDLTHYDYGFRVYNPAIARFLSVDPLSASFPFYTPYQFAGNMPIWAIDLDGLEELKVTEKTEIKAGQSFVDSEGNLHLSDSENEKPQIKTERDYGLIFKILRGGASTVGLLLMPANGNITYNQTNPNLGATYERYSNDATKLSESELEEARQRVTKGIPKPQDWAAIIELRSRNKIASKPNYENPGHHDPVNGDEKYNPNKSVIPANHGNIWDLSIEGSDGNRWTKVGNGKKAVYHRFQNDGNDNWHWNGSTDGKTANGTPREISPNNVPIEVKRSEGIEFNEIKS